MTNTSDSKIDTFQRAATLRQASDTFLARLDRLHELETRKRELPPGQPEFVRLAREVEDLARALLHTSGVQGELADKVSADVKSGAAPANVPIRETPARRDAVAVLSDWRAAERRLAAARAGSAEEHAARRDVDRLRLEYRQITNPIPPDAK
jgi:hypothetical protein